MMAAATPAAMLSSCGSPVRPEGKAGRRVLVVAFDGLDPEVAESLMQAGRMPNFAKLASGGGFARLATSTPPHTPVAFANIISGADPGLHQVFDFIHRDANPAGTTAAMRPRFSTAEVVPPEHDWAMPLGRWRLPLVGSKTELLRRGPAFWDYLVAAGVDTDIYYVPSNYPATAPKGSGRFRAISGMGTPDLLGGYGEFTLFTPDVPLDGRQVGGGRLAFLSMFRDRGRGELIGPPNFLRKPGPGGSQPPLTAVLDFVRDPETHMAKIEVSGTTVLLAEGEWSDWVSVEFPTGIPGSGTLRAAGAPTSVWGMVRFYMKQVHPWFELYVSPVNIDPSMPASPITAPAGFASELVRQHGRFSTLGIPEDTKALTNGALNEDEFLAQSELALKERIEQYRHALANFSSGCLFFYFGGTDLLQHMFWRDRDPEHPGYDPEQAQRYGRVVEEAYLGADRLVGEALEVVGPDDVLMVLSDHGFTTFRRGFNLNTWLLEKGYLKLRDPALQGREEMFTNVDWSATQAYGLGMNGLYVNEAGREKYGSVKPADRRRLLAEIRERLMEVRDGDAAAVIGQVALVEDLYAGADPTIAPDLIVGYTPGYRASWATVLGKMPRELIEDNLDRWSGTHLIDADRIPGVLLTNRKLAAADPRLIDIAPTILDAFGVARPAYMTGRALFSEVASHDED